MSTTFRIRGREYVTKLPTRLGALATARRGTRATPAPPRNA